MKRQPDATWRHVLPLAGLALVGCRPAQFDRLGHERTLSDAGALEDAAADDSDAPSSNDSGAQPDASDSADAATAEEAGAEDACAAPLDGMRELVVTRPPLELARLSQPPSVSYRKLGASAWLGAHRVWSFSETGLTGDASIPSEAPVNYPSAALDGADQPWTKAGQEAASAWQLTETLTDAGIPQPLLTRFPEELGQALGLEVTAIVKTSAKQALGGLAYVRNFTSLLSPTQVWLADLEDGAPLAMRRATPLFVAPEPLFCMGAQLDATYLKLFACHAEPAAAGGMPSIPCVVARVPVEAAAEHDAYEAYARDEQGSWSWTNDLTRASPVLYASEAELSVSWNEHLQQYLAVHSAYFSNQVILHTAPQVEGPWTEGIAITLAAPPAWPALYAREHPDLQQRCGKRIIISHWAATSLAPNGLPNAGDVVLDAIDLD